MRVGNTVLIVAALLVGSSVATSVKASTDGVDPANLLRPIETESRFLSAHKVTRDEGRMRSAIASKVDELVNPEKLKAAMKDITTMKALFRQWNADPIISKQVIARLSMKETTLVRFVLPYNGYRMEVARSAARVDALVSPKNLNAALQDNKKMKELFKLWNVDEAIAMRVIERLSRNLETFNLYSPLILRFNAYRLSNAAKVV
ncbi:hypothetical protein GN244_ATG04956 [Phytophthora infestans]|uniref:RxLR effector protein n=1 Tax=Phytophthora infestans TaxID=4787 RepID=A0A833WMT3_PHYIN|nr:hypothetical protein GN244_ATG04956 [Phytophthora infestans]